MPDSGAVSDGPRIWPLQKNQEQTIHYLSSYVIISRVTSLSLELRIVSPEPTQNPKSRGSGQSSCPGRWMRRSRNRWEIGELARIWTTLIATVHQTMIDIRS